MGMAASQARLLALNARMNNIEYQGQQINQERTVLSQQVNTLYNSLLTLDVPTPPSTSEFTTIKYEGTEGASNFTLGNIVPTGTSYSVDLNYTKTGHYMDMVGTASAQSVPSTLRLSTVTTRTPSDGIDATGVVAGIPTTPAANDTIMHAVGIGSEVTPQQGETYYIKEGNNFIEIQNPRNYPSKKIYTRFEYDTSTPQPYSATEDYNLGQSPSAVKVGGYTASELKSIGYIIDNDRVAHYLNDANIEEYFESTQTTDGTLTLKNEYSSYSIAVADSSTQAEEYTNGDKTDPNLVGIVAGEPCYTLAGAYSNGSFDLKTLESYVEAVRDAIPEFADMDSAQIQQQFSVYFTTDPDTRRQIAHFVKTQDITSAFSNMNNNYYVNTYDYIANGQYTEVENKKECTLTFDSQGRISEIGIPTSYNVDGSPKSYRKIKLEATTVTDNLAYQDAYAKYEYAQYEYDKKQQEINAKTEIIQKEDKNLELKLTRLNNEREAVKTEIEAVKTVIKDDITESFKAFT